MAKTKEALVEAVASKIGCSKRQAADAVETIFDTITESLKRGEDLMVTGFGSFRVGKRAARTGRNPKTGARIQIPAMRVPKFKAGKGLKEAVR